MRLHTHRCEDCGHVFTHDRGSIRRGLLGWLDNHRAHMCPQCGGGPWLYVDGIVGAGGKVMSTDALAVALHRRGHSARDINAAIERELNPD